MNPGNDRSPKTARPQAGLSCPWAGRCGGCDTIGQTYERTLAAKEQYVSRLLRPYVRLDGITGMEEPWHYRNKVHRVCACRTKGRGISRVSGIYAEGTHQVIPVKECLLEDIQAQRIIDSVLLLAESFRIPYYDEDMHSGLLRHVLVRTAHATGQIMVILVMASTQFPGKKNFVRELCRLHPEITTIVININSRNTSMMLGEQESTVYGKGYIEDLLCGMRFGISSRSFYQVNSLQTEKLYGEAIRMAGLTCRENVLDAYCGIGTIGLIASPHAGRVLGLELNKDAVRDAVENARRNAVRNISFRAGDAGEYLDRHLQDEKSDVIFMDPPRSGATRQFLTSAARSSAGRIVYISCNPETLARDLGILTKLGYTVQQARSYDMFPWTQHIETVCLLTHS